MSLPSSETNFYMRIFAMKLMLLLPSSAWMTCRRLPPTYLRRSLLIRNFSVVVVVPNIEPWLDIERSLRKFWLSVAAILQIAAAFSSTEEEGLLEIESTWKVRVTPNQSKVCVVLDQTLVDSSSYPRPKYDGDDGARVMLPPARNRTKGCEIVFQHFAFLYPKDIL